jgi:hypothetical protein
MEKKNSNRIKIILALIPVIGAIAVALISHPWRKDVQPPKETNKMQYFLSGAIVDASSNNSIPQAEITIVGRNEQYVSENNGNFRLPFKDSIGHVRIRVTRKDYLPYDKSYDLPSSDIIIQLKHK